MKKNQYSDLLLDQIKDIVWAVDRNLFLVYANKAYLSLMKEVTGIDKELNTPILIEGFGEGYIEKWEAYYQRALSGEYFEIEEDFYNPETKETQYGHIAFSPIRDERGEILTVACRSTDITPNIRQKDHASQLMDASLDVFCTIDEAGKFVFVSAVSAHHWGYHPEELIGKPYRDLIVEEDLEKTDLVAAEIMEGKEFKSFLNRFRKKNGGIAYNLWSARWGYESKLMYCVARDAKDKIEEEQRLKLLEKVINSTTDAIVITDAQPLDAPGPAILYVNKAFTKMTGYSSKEVLGKNPRFLQGPDSNKEDLKKLGEKLRRLESAEITVLNYTKAGEEFWVNFAVSPVTDQRGEITHLISIQRDVTEQKNQHIEKELISEISFNFSEEEELVPASIGLCKSLNTFGKFDLIELWCPNMEQTQIKLMGCSTQNEDFYDLEPSGTSFQKNEGMPGKVWEKGKQLLWDEKQINKYFIRKKGASHLGLQAIIGIPLTFNDELVGVLLIGTKQDSDYLKQQGSLLSRLEKVIGSEIKRKRLENNLRNVFDAIPEILCITDFEGRFLKINNAASALLGYATDELLFHSLDEFTLKEDKGKFEQKIKGITKEVSVFTFENRFLSKDGQVIWLSWNCNTALEEGLVYASAKNITAEVQLRELNAQAGSLAKIGSWEVDLEKNAIFWSEIVHEIHETDPESFVPDLESAIAFYREDFRPMVAKEIEEAIAVGSTFEFEAVIITKSLNERWIRAIGKTEQVDGVTTRFIGSFQDITDRKESELRLQALSDDLPGVTFQYVILPDGQDSMRSVSKASSKIWGLSAEECEKNINKVWEQIKKAGDLDEVQQSIQQSIASGEKWHFRWRNVLPTGELRWHEGFGTPNHLADGTVIFNSMIFDITDEKKAVLLYEETADTARLGTWEIDMISQKVYLSKVTREIHELDEKTEISIEDGLNFYKESFREVARIAIQNGIENGEPWEFELPIITAKGNERWVRGIGQAELIEGKVVRLFGSFQDIHQRKIAELRLQSVANDLPGVVFQYHLYSDGKDRLLTVSNGSKHIWGLSPQQCEADINLVWNQIKKGGDYEQVVQDITHSIQTKTQWHSKWRSILPDGTLRWHKGFGTPYFQPDGTITYNSMVFDYTDEKLAVDLYQQALAEKATILESISDAFYAVDADWNFTYFNKEAENLLKKSADEVLGGNIWEIFSPAKGTILEEVYRRVASTGQSENFEYHYPGDGCWYELTVYSSSGGVSSYFKNIDERRKAAQELEKAYKEKNEILESIGDAFFAVDEEWTVTYWNKQAETILGRVKKDIVGKNVWEEFPDAIDTDFYRQYHQAMETGETVNFEEYYPTLDMWIEVSVYPSENGLSIYFKDISLKKAADIRLLEANERFELVTKATNDAIWDWDIENDNFNRSNNIHKMLGSHASTKLKKNEFWQDSFHLEDVGKLQESIQSALNDPHSERWEMEYKVLNDKNAELFIIDRGIIVRNKNGKATRMVGAMTDLTKQKKLEKELFQLSESLKSYSKELERSNEELEQFAFITSHDLQEPLRMITSFMDQLKRKYSDQLDDKALQYIYFATDGAKRMKQIILDLLLYSRANKPSEQLEEVNLNEIAAEYTQLRRKLIAENNASITFDELPVLKTNKAPITQIIHCLLDNALRYVKENGTPRIEIHAKEKETVWEFAIKDNGIGIDQMFHDKIFIIFQRLHNRKQYDGTGIGLSIAKRSVEFLGGEIWLESTVGEGSTFYFTISKNN
ncbi:PAS domain S-box protein [Algoriphagus sp. C2-6-M1]|uniref:PAS domain S-box protein n=1 Tax=Algoriphagus persicinus TaxID=3108754 RepID=UPI002B38517F|nr:PAS domain S-box protein [Algoriphagus sp. C2-6-M1]MEB2780968.1 PAS domain S-box protein [Algoriphagus sp. C2-6-M1]